MTTPPGVTAVMGEPLEAGWCTAGCRVVSLARRSLCDGLGGVSKGDGQGPVSNRQWQACGGSLSHIGSMHEPTGLDTNLHVRKGTPDSQEGTQ